MRDDGGYYYGDGREDAGNLAINRAIKAIHEWCINRVINRVINGGIRGSSFSHTSLWHFCHPLYHFILTLKENHLISYNTLIATSDRVQINEGYSHLCCTQIEME